MDLGIRKLIELCEKGGKAPTRVLIFKDGNVGIDHDVLSDVILDRESAQTIIAEFERRGIQLVIDYHHATQRAAPGDKAKAAGWIKSLAFEDGVGLTAEVEWTDEAKAEIERQEFKYLSPVMMIDKVSKRIEKLMTVALTNTPATNNAVELVAAEWKPIQRSDTMSKKRSTKVAADLHPVEPEGNPEEGADDMTPVKTSSLVALADAVKAAGGELDETADADSVIAMAIDKLAGAAGEPEAEPSAAAIVSRTVTEKMADINEALGIAKDSTMAVACETIHKQTALSGSSSDQAKKLVEVQAELKVLTDERKASQIEAFIDEHVEAGRLNPHNEKQMKAVRCLAESDMPKCKEFVEAMEVIADPTRTDFSGGTPTNDRERVMAESRKYWNDNPKERQANSVEAWVNSDLIGAGEEVLTEDETKKLAVC